MTCPGCDSESSSVLSAFRDGDPCPFCGLSAQAAAEIDRIHQTRADEALKTQVKTAIKERDAAQREARWAKARLSRVERDLGALLALVKKPLESEEIW